MYPPPPKSSKQQGVARSLLYSGSKFQGFQKSKGNSYVVEVELQVSRRISIFCVTLNIMIIIMRATDRPSAEYRTPLHLAKTRDLANILCLCQLVGFY